LPEIISALNALMNNKKIAENQVAGIPIETLQAVLNKLKAAQYAVIIWRAGNFQYAHAELTVQSITHLIAKLNENTRVAGLPLNAGDGDTSINNTSTWLSGYPTRTRFFADQASYDAHHFSSRQQLKKCDALLWISTFNKHQPPICDVPTIVIGHPNMQFDKVPEVFIPVGIPGADHVGTMFRMDSSVVMPLKKLRESELPSLSEVIHQIEVLLA
jgi:formylmethanofuran dehydrogenase subunit B